MHLNLAFLCVEDYLMVFTAEVIPYREQWNRVTKVESYNYDFAPWLLQEPYYTMIDSHQNCVTVYTASSILSLFVLTVSDPLYINNADGSAL